MEKRKRDNYLEYMAVVHRAKLDMKCKALLWHYAWAFNWKARNPSFYTQKQICAYTSMSPSTYQKARRKLLELGWIQEKKISGDLPVFVTPKVGQDDPAYESWSWAKGHGSNTQSIEEHLSGFSEDFRDPFKDVA